MDKGYGPWEGPVGKYIDGEATDDSYAGCEQEMSGDGIECDGDIWTRVDNSWRQFQCQAHRDITDKEETGNA